MAGLETIIEAIGALGKSLIPDSNADPRIQYLWRVRIGIVVCGTFGGLLFITGLAFGALRWTGFEGFAREGDIAAVAAQQKADIVTLAAQRVTDLSQQRKDRESTLDTNIVELRIKHCEAPTSEGRQLYWDKIARRMDEYTEITGRGYTLPECKDL